MTHANTLRGGMGEDRLDLALQQAHPFNVASDGCADEGLASVLAGLDHVPARGRTGHDFVSAGSGNDRVIGRLEATDLASGQFVLTHDAARARSHVWWDRDGTSGTLPLQHLVQFATGAVSIAHGDILIL